MTISRAKKISELVATSSPSSDDLLVIVDAPAGSAVTKKVTVGDLLGNSSANVVVSNSAVLSARNIINRRKETPVTSATQDPAGTLFFDDNYLYIATSNGTLKRVPLSSF